MPPLQPCPVGQDPSVPQVKQPLGEVPHSRVPQSLAMPGWAQAPDEQTSFVQPSLSLVHAFPPLAATQLPAPPASSQVWHSPHATPSQRSQAPVALQVPVGQAPQA